MSSDAGLNTEEVKEALAAAEASGNLEDARYLQRVLDSRAVPKAVVHAYEIVGGNPGAYPEETVRQQSEEAIGRPGEPVKADDLGVRGSVPAPEPKAAKKS
jgi:predicted DsbA family dithiol-disulfide isomerase